MDFSRDKLIEIWARAMPNEPPPALFDTLVFPGDGERPLPSESGDAADGCGSPDDRDAADGCDVSDDRETVAELRRGVERELELAALYHALARYALAHPASARGDVGSPPKSAARELMRLSNEQYASAKAVAGAHLLASGEYFFPSPAPVKVKSLREGLRRAWALERELAAAYARLEPLIGGGRLRHSHSSHSLALCGLLGNIFG